MNPELQAALVAVVAGAIFEVSRDGWALFSKWRQTKKVSEQIYSLASNLIEKTDWRDQKASSNAEFFFKQWRDLNIFVNRFHGLMYEHASEKNLREFIWLSRIIADLEHRLWELKSLGGEFPPQAFIAISMTKSEIAKFEAERSKFLHATST